MLITGQEFPLHVVLRHHGEQQERYSVGFIDKSGTYVDFIDWSTPCHSTNLVIEGYGEYITHDGRRFELFPGMCFNRFFHRPHTTLLRQSSHWKECFVSIGGALAAVLQSFNYFDLDTPVLSINLDQALYERFLRLADGLKRSKPENIGLLLPDFCALIWDCNHPRREIVDNQDIVIERCCAFLSRNHMADRDFKKFCRQHGYSYENVRKLFTQKVGMPPAQFRIKSRLESACKLLTCPQYSIAEIAETLGYNSAYEFSAQFKKHFGEPPGRYRKTLIDSSACKVINANLGQ